MLVSYTKKQEKHIPGTQRAVIDDVYVLVTKYQVTSYVVIEYSHI